MSNVNLFCVLCLLSQSAVAELSAEQRVSGAVWSQQVSCVRIISLTDDRSSGVVISNRGHILSVAHGLQAEHKVADVITASGRRLKADILHRDPAVDVALLKLRDLVGQEDIAPVLLGLSGGHKPSDLKDRIAVSVGYPAREKSGLMPVVRLGSVSAATSKHIRTSCVLTTGDSGGPVFDSNGLLLGIHQKIGLGKETNLHLPLTLCLQSLAQQLKREKIEVVAVSGSPQRALNITRAPAVAVVEQSRRLTVRVSDADTGKALCHGTWIGANVVATKLSELGNRDDVIVGFAGKSPVPGRVAGRIRTSDLAILKLSKAESAIPEGVPFLPALKQGFPLSLLVGGGSFVYVDAAHPAGIVSRPGHDEPASAPSLGCTLRLSEKSVEVETVGPQGSAATAGLRRGDRIVEIDKKEIGDLDDVSEQLSNQQPGDYVTFRVFRNGMSVELLVQLHHAANKILDRAEYLDGLSGNLSMRRTGFTGVIQHDIAISAEEMGGPLVNSRGQLVGINIARRSRESVLALPILAVLKLAKNTSPASAKD